MVTAGIPAQVDNASTPPYSGGLTLGPNASLQVGWTTNHAANANALGSGTITMNAQRHAPLTMYLGQVQEDGSVRVYN